MVAFDTMHFVYRPEIVYNSSELGARPQGSGLGGGAGTLTGDLR